MLQQMVKYTKPKILTLKVPITTVAEDILFSLSHFKLSRLPHTIYWKSLISILGTSGYEI